MDFTNTRYSRLFEHHELNIFWTSSDKPKVRIIRDDILHRFRRLMANSIVFCSED